jgi:hypothetical protein
MPATFWRWPSAKKNRRKLDLNHQFPNRKLSCHASVNPKNMSEEIAKKPQFRRINFYNGLFTSAEDWKAEQAYHVEKQRLHNQRFHSPGIVAGALQEFKVEFRGDKIIVLPGYAVDGYGRDIYLAEERELRHPPQIRPHGNEEQSFLCVSLKEKETALRKNDFNPQFQGHSFIEDYPEFEWEKAVSENKNKVVLARFTWKAGPSLPRDYTIDRSSISFTGPDRTMAYVKSGYRDLEASQTGDSMSFSMNDPRTLIELPFRQPEEASGLFYIANVFPVEILYPKDVEELGKRIPSEDEHRIIWRIESTFSEKNGLAYYLVFKNCGNAKVKVKYEIYRFNSSPRQLHVQH